MGGPAPPPPGPAQTGPPALGPAPASWAPSLPAMVNLGLSRVDDTVAAKHPVRTSA